uniref:protein mono-ADP-ribosyltransferase PARP12-like n=1 Tax=Pristiophorus japonicus TaxID=55135 RepID=UPI00398F3BD7
MALSKLPQNIIKILCSNNGSLCYEELRRKISDSDAVSDLNLIMTLRNNQLFTIVRGTGSKIPECELTLDSRIVASTVIRLCKDYPNKKCQDCGKLHLCRFFMFGNCKYAEESNTCKHSHDIHDSHNWKIIRVNKLQELNVNELRFLLLQNDLSLLPEVCLHYNRGSENLRFGSCSHKDICNKLHICSYFISGNCRFRAECRRSHSFRDDDVSALLKKLCLDENVVHNLLLIYQNRNHIKQAPSTDGMNATSPSYFTNTQRNAGTEEICLYFIRKNCSFKDMCLRVHFSLPYRWQICKGTWQDFPNMEEIEMAFCDPNNITSLEPTPINFETMMCESHPVRRLSTASSVTKPPHYILTTEWLWYMENAVGKWTEYGTQDQVHVASADLENVYLASSSDEVSIGEFSERLSFKEMIQKDKLSEGTNKVRRRPRFISKEDMERKIQSKVQLAQRQASAWEPKNIPKNWDKSALPDMGCKRIQLSQFSEEYKKIQSLFNRSMQSSRIQKIDRVQNLGLWEIFQWKKEQMRKKNDADNVNEQFLFHGITDHSIVDAICYQNFDWGSFAQDENLYGKGIYFAKKASSSILDSDSAINLHVMFVARVLVGQFTEGHSSYRRPPSIDGTSFNLFDSCVDCTNDPSVFVIFEKYQIYPEYVIEYRIK